MKRITLKQNRHDSDYPYIVIKLVNELRFDIGEKLTREELVLFMEKNKEVEVEIK